MCRYPWPITKNQLLVLSHCASGWTSQLARHDPEPSWQIALSHLVTTERFLSSNRDIQRQQTRANETDTEPHRVTQNNRAKLWPPQQPFSTVFSRFQTPALIWNPTTWSITDNIYFQQLLAIRPRPQLLPRVLVHSRHSQHTTIIRNRFHQVLNPQHPFLTNSMRSNHFQVLSTHSTRFQRIFVESSRFQSLQRVYSKVHTLFTIFGCQDAFLNVNTRFQPTAPVFVTQHRVPTVFEPLLASSTHSTYFTVSVRVYNKSLAFSTTCACFCG